MTNKQRLLYLKKLWRLHVDSVFVPRSSSHELFITCLAQIFAPTGAIVEYGPFTGATSFFLVSAASLVGQHSYLIDNSSQSTGLDLVEPDKFYDILRANAGLIKSNEFTIIDRDVFVDPIIDQDTGFVFYDICVGQQGARAARNMLTDMSQRSNPAIVVIDDAVTAHDTNNEFLDEWSRVYDQSIDRFKPFFLTKNRLFLSNFNMDFRFNNAIRVLHNHGYLSIMNDLHQFYRKQINFAQQGNNKTMKHQNFLRNDRLWEDLCQSVEGTIL